MIKRILLVVLALVALAGCDNTLAQYRPQPAPGGGYRECILVKSSKDDHIYDRRGLYCKTYTVHTVPDQPK